MDVFLSSMASFFKEMFTYGIIAIFLENTIFSRALGTSTALFAIRKQYNLLIFGVVMTSILSLAAVITYFIHPIVDALSFSYYVVPLVYMLVIGALYLAAVQIGGKLLKKRKPEVLSCLHISVFNCAVLGALLLASNVADIGLGGFLGFGIGTGIGFTVATYFMRLAYQHLSSEHVPQSFQGFPITLIYIGLVSLGIYGLIGHELPF